MYNERPDQIVYRHKDQISLVQIFSAFIVVMMTLVLPVQLMEYHKAQSAAISPYSINAPASQSAGRVAGASTTAQSTNLILSQTTIFQQYETQVLVAIAAVLLMIGVAILVYLIISKPKPRYPAPSPEFILELQTPYPRRGS
jgi:uncharacterized membrane protein YeiB